MRKRKTVGRATGEAQGERVYRISGNAENGDCHLIATNDPVRAAAYHDWLADKFADVHGNPGFEEIVRPNLEMLREIGKFKEGDESAINPRQGRA